ncbi:hypothetical protein [Methanoregula sp.]|uniref:hypothetical protein n=1 Tax=Methanoregula sp. TaxID=2052170 RepID=UPI002B7BC37D|nr:hypothetical protein [Methanoregula sp.]HVP97640.1 hypothetical protein [Methanoregula sp.]
MDNTEAARNALRGTTIAEKLASIGIERGRMVEIRHLDSVGRDYGIAVYLFFEKDLAMNRTLAQVEAEFRGVPEYERPYVRVDRFLAFTQENDPSFLRTLDEFPMMIEIASVSEEPDPATGRSLPVIIGLMPFLDEFDVDVDLTKQSGQNLR